jgi:hypothetical protein
MRRALCLVLLLWVTLGPPGDGLLGHADVVRERWPAAEAPAARFGPAAGLLPYGVATLLLAAPVALGAWRGRREGARASPATPGSTISTSASATSWPRPYGAPPGNRPVGPCYIRRALRPCHPLASRGY